MTPDALAVHLTAAFRRRPPVSANEADLQARLAVELAALPVVVHREHRLDRASRLDFLVEGVAVEVKVGGTLAAVTRQLFRYADYPAVLGLLLVSTRYDHRRVPEVVLGKPCACLCLGDYLL